MEGCPAGVSMGTYSNNCWIELLGPKRRPPSSSRPRIGLDCGGAGPRLPADIGALSTNTLICRSLSSRLPTKRFDVLSFLRGLGILELDLFDSHGADIRIGPASVESLVLDTGLARFISQVEPQRMSSTLHHPPQTIILLRCSEYI